MYGVGRINSRIRSDDTSPDLPRHGVCMCARARQSVSQSVITSLGGSLHTQTEVIAIKVDIIGRNLLYFNLIFSQIAANL